MLERSFGQHEFAAQLDAFVTALRGLEISAQLPEAGQAERRLQRRVRLAVVPVEVQFYAGPAGSVGGAVVDLDLEWIESERGRRCQQYQ